GKLLPTETGVAFFRALPESATLPDMTALWSAQQSDIEQGNQTVEEFVNTLLDNLRKLVITVNVSEIKGEVKPNGGQVERLATPCSNCGKYIVVRPKLFACTGCDFKIWSTVAEKKLTTKQVETLIQKGKTGIIKGFKSKAGKNFDAKLKLEKSGKLVFEFESNR
ncbi:MAG TPA: topoisomerase C-terminal repeat-containing protein, partial [Arsenophonus apicola]